MDNPEFMAFSISSDVLFGEDPEMLDDYVQAMGLTMPVLADWDGSTYNDWMVDAPDTPAPYPREFIVDRDGIVIYVAVDIEIDAIEAVLDGEL